MITIKATRIESGADLQHGPPGCFAIPMFEGEPAGIAFQCPCGCGNEGWLPVANATPGTTWGFDGNMDRPTLSPSVFNRQLPCQWHGWLRNGEWVSA